MYKIIPIEDRWVVVRQVGDTPVFLHEAATHKEALEVRQSLLNEQPLPDDYDNYIEVDVDIL